MVGAYCWYAGTYNESCDDLCLTRGGCDLEGTRGYAGSGGTDAHCKAVLKALGFGKMNHQSFSNNPFGCHSAWGWTYWSKAAPTTCGIKSGAVIRMCACNE